MTTVPEATTTSVPARDIGVPLSVSAQAQAMLALGMVGPEPEWADLTPGDTQAWKALIAARTAAVLAMSPTGRGCEGATVEERDLGDVVVFTITPDGVDPADPRVYLEFHGGGFIQDGGDVARARAVDTAVSLGARVWSVDYRMPPDHPFPTPVEDCLSAYRTLLKEHRPEQVVVGGPSAGGNLAAVTLLQARDDGDPLPAGCVLFSPCTDLTEGGDTFHTNEGVDTVMRGSFLPSFQLYAGGHDLRDPRLSPVFADLTRGFPPTLLVSGTRDKLLSDTVRFHRALRAAGVPAELLVIEAAGHAGFLGMAPEDEERAGDVRRFVHARWAAAGAQQP